MMSYQRNEIYISKEEQEKLKTFSVFFAGCGIGSNIAECALRLGFENQTLIDGDTVELSNLNRQNYNQTNIGFPKSEALKKRLLSINPDANITTVKAFLNDDNMGQLVPGHHVAINALDFQSDIPLKFDEFCQDHHIPVLHPYNIGWATVVFVVLPNGQNLSGISKNHIGFEKKVATFLIENLTDYPKQWISSILSEYAKKEQEQSPPQLSIGSWLAAGVCTNIMYRLAVGKEVKQFPDFYFTNAVECEP